MVFGVFAPRPQYGALRRGTDQVAREVAPSHLPGVGRGLVGLGGDQAVRLPGHKSRVAALQDVGDHAAAVGVADDEDGDGDGSLGNPEGLAAAPRSRAARVAGPDPPGVRRVLGERGATSPRELGDGGLLELQGAGLIDAHLVPRGARRLAPGEQRSDGVDSARRRLGRGPAGLGERAPVRPGSRRRGAEGREQHQRQEQDPEKDSRLPCPSIHPRAPHCVPLRSPLDMLIKFPSRPRLRRRLFLPADEAPGSVVRAPRPRLQLRPIPRGRSCARCTGRPSSCSGPARCSC